VLPQKTCRLSAKSGQILSGTATEFARASKFSSRGLRKEAEQVRADTIKVFRFIVGPLITFRHGQSVPGVLN
jgi:hypothetical protein